MKSLSYNLLFALCFFLPIASFGAEQEKNADGSQQISEVTLFGLKLIGATRDEVVDQLWEIGGFKLARSSMKQKGFDRFFTKYRIRDSYFVEFRYNAQKEVISVKRLFRPASIVYKNRRDDIQTNQVALDLVEEIGQPTHIERKSWGGTPSYKAYFWENDQIKITVDREGQEILGNVFVLYEMKINPYLVADNRQ